MSAFEGKVDIIPLMSAFDRRGRRAPRNTPPRRNGCADIVLSHSRIGALLLLRGQCLRRSPGPSSSPQRQSRAQRVCVCEAALAPPDGIECFFAVANVDGKPHTVWRGNSVMLVVDED